MDIKVLKQIEATRREIAHIDKILSRMESKIVEDSVQGSSNSFPYVKRHIKIEGFENPKNRRKYVGMITHHKNKLEKQKLSLEYEIQNINDSEIRTIIRMKYFDGLTFNQIAHRLNREREKRIHRRFCEKKTKQVFRGG